MGGLVCNTSESGDFRGSNLLTPVESVRDSKPLGKFN